MSDNPWRRVLATHEEAQGLSTGPWLGDSFPGVALPSVHALRRWIMIRYHGKETCAQAMDVGPWCEDDEDYVFRGKQPRAEKLIGKVCPTREGGSVLPSVPDGKGGFRTVDRSNGAGIDLFPAVAKALDIPLGDNVFIDWFFVDFPE